MRRITYNDVRTWVLCDEALFISDNASQRIVQMTEMGAGEQMLVQRAADTTRGLQRNSIDVPPIYIPTNANAYAERRVTKSFSKSSFSLSILVAVHVHEVF